MVGFILEVDDGLVVFGVASQAVPAPVICHYGRQDGLQGGFSHGFLCEGFCGRSRGGGPVRVRAVGIIFILIRFLLSQVGSEVSGIARKKRKTTQQRLNSHSCKSEFLSKLSVFTGIVLTSLSSSSSSSSSLALLLTDECWRSLTSSSSDVSGLSSEGSAAATFLGIETKLSYS